METNPTNQINKTFQDLMEREARVFDFSKLENKFRAKKDIVYDAYFTFSNDLVKEIKALPFSPIVIDKLGRWIDNLDYWIKSKNGAKLSEATNAHLHYRKELKEKLSMLYKGLTINEVNDSEDIPAETNKELTLKQQILLLEALKILNIPAIESLPDTKQAKLFSHLLNRSEKTVKDHLTYLGNSADNPKFFIRKEDNVKRINELLKSVGLQEYVIN